MIVLVLLAHPPPRAWTCHSLVLAAKLDYCAQNTFYCAILLLTNTPYSAQCIVQYHKKLHAICTLPAQEEVVLMCLRIVECSFVLFLWVGRRNFNPERMYRNITFSFRDVPSYCPYSLLLITRKHCDVSDNIGQCILTYPSNITILPLFYCETILAIILSG